MQSGRIVQFGTPEIIHRQPASSFVAGFVGYANAIPVDIEAGSARLRTGEAVLRPADPRGISGPAIAFIHAGDVALRPVAEPGENRLLCRVAALAFMGDHIEYVLEHLPGLRLKAQVRSDSGNIRAGRSGGRALAGREAGGGSGGRARTRWSGGLTQIGWARHD